MHLRVSCTSSPSSNSPKQIEHDSGSSSEAAAAAMLLWRCSSSGCCGGWVGGVAEEQSPLPHAVLSVLVVEDPDAAAAAAAAAEARLTGLVYRRIGSAAITRNTLLTSSLEALTPTQKHNSMYCR